METAAIDELDRNVDTHWWHLARRRIVTTLFRQHLNGKAAPAPASANGGPGARPVVLDVGCGVGDYGIAFAPFAIPLGVDRLPESIKCARKRGYGRLVQGDVLSLPIWSGRVDGLIALDVLEHVVEDEQALREYYRCLRPGGLLLITVPAYPWMWSDLDTLYGHVRRYVRGELEGKVKAAGFTVRKISYFNSFLFPVQASVRIVQRMLKRWVTFNSSSSQAPKSALVNRTLAACFGAEANWLKVGRFPCGVSLICVAQKPEQAA